MDESPYEDKKIFKIEKIESLDVSQKIDATEISPGEIVPSKTKFDSAVAKAEAVMEQKVAPVRETDSAFLSPIHEMKTRATNVQRIGPASKDAVLQQVSDLKERVTSSTQTIEETLNKYPQLKLKPVEESPLSEKLIHADATLRSTLNIAGAEITAVNVAPETKNPLVKFLSYLTHGDKQLNSLERELTSLEGKEITPGKLITIQVKLSYVQREIEFFTNALNKALESAKTIMNVQV